MHNLFLKNLSNRLHEKYSLTLPVDINFVARKFADLRFHSIPHNIDGICIGLKKIGKRPKIIINTNSHQNRIRFTIAHEIGHIVIPWHVGTVIDHIEYYHNDSSYVDYENEKEANFFASNLLMPEDWMKSFLGMKNNLAKITETISIKAKVSYLAAAFRFISLLPPGFLLIVKKNGLVKYACKSPNTPVYLPKLNEKFSIKKTFYLSKNLYNHKITNNIYYWVELPTKIPLLQSSDKNWRPKLEIILKNIFPSTEIIIAKRSLNGIFGNLKGTMNTNDTDFCEKFISRSINRLSNDETFKDILKHDLFQKFISCKALDFKSK